MNKLFRFGAFKPVHEYGICEICTFEGELEDSQLCQACEENEEEKALLAMEDDMEASL